MGMRIVLQNISKQFKEDWIFRGVNFEFTTGNSCVILGPNGSGKSTLLSIVSSHMLPTNGSVRYFDGEKELKQEDIFRSVAVCSPYIELIEEFTLVENANFFCSFKNLLKGITANDIAGITNLTKSKNKPLQQFSSGMKQRVKLALALLADVPVVLLDEPCSNLDAEGVDWYNGLINKYSENRLFLVSSNDLKFEFGFCNTVLQLMEFKK